MDTPDRAPSACVCVSRQGALYVNKEGASGGGGGWGLGRGGERASGEISAGHRGQSDITIIRPQQQRWNATPD